jgi:Poly(ADP-ribose) polymerase and DNA-Ligase Zn-finger region
MPDTIEIATSGRAKCRGCGQPIGKGALRFGERHPNAFGDGEMTLWFHPRCAAYKRPEPFLAALAGASLYKIEDASDLEAAAQFGVAHRRVPRINGAERAPTGRARCRSCRELIERGAWRIPLVYFEESRFEPSGFVHATCAHDYFSTVDLIEHIKHFSPALGDADLDDLKTTLEAAPTP